MKAAGTLAILALFLLGASGASQETRLPSTPASLDFDPNFRNVMIRYATVDRADGKVYDLYVSAAAFDILPLARQVPSGVSLAIESFSAERNAAGALVRDADGWLVKAVSDNDVHVSMKALEWVDREPMSSQGQLLGEPTSGGTWRMAGFDPRTGEPTAGLDVSLCHGCHRDRRSADFVLSRDLLDAFAQTGQPTRISLPCRARDICT